MHEFDNCTIIHLLLDTIVLRKKLKDDKQRHIITILFLWIKWIQCPYINQLWLILVGECSDHLTLSTTYAYTKIIIA